MVSDTPDNSDLDRNESSAYLDEQAENSPVAESLHELPPIISRGLLYLLTLFAVIAVIYCWVSKIDITRSARASIVPEGHVQQVQSDADGVLTRLLVTEGQEVRQGQLLAVVDSQEVVRHLSALRTAQAALSDSVREQQEVLPLKEKQLQAKVEILKEKNRSLVNTEKVLLKRIDKENASLQFSEQLHLLQLKRQQETLKRIDVEIANAQASVDLWTRELKTMETLVKKRAASELEYLNVKRSKESALGEVVKLNSVKREEKEKERIAEVELEAARNTHEKAVAQIQEMISNTQVSIQSAKLEQVQIEQQIELMKLEARKAHELIAFRHQQALQQAKLNLPGVDEATLQRVAAGEGVATDKTEITAPMDGVIGKIYVMDTGGAVMRGRALMTLVPKDTRLVAEIRVPGKDIGLVHQEMATRMKFDAFPFAEYGVITGKLELVVPVAESPQNAPSHYRAYSSLDQDYFVVKGEPVKLMPGMDATAEIVTEQKSILSLLLQPLLEFGKPTRAKSVASGPSDP